MTKKFPLIILIILVVAMVILVIIFLTPKKGGEELELEEEEEIEEIAEPEKEAPVIAEEIYGISGEIKEIKDRILLVEANILLADLSKEPIKQMVEIRVADDTRILKLKFPEEIPEGSTELISPEETEIGYSDLKVGDIIDVETTDNVSENIKNKTEITASVINVVE